MQRLKKKKAAGSSRKTGKDLMTSRKMEEYRRSRTWERKYLYLRKEIKMQWETTGE